MKTLILILVIFIVAISVTCFFMFMNTSQDDVDKVNIDSKNDLQTDAVKNAPVSSGNKKVVKFKRPMIEEVNKGSKGILNTVDKKKVNEGKTVKAIKDGNVPEPSTPKKKHSDITTIKKNENKPDIVKKNPNITGRESDKID